MAAPSLSPSLSGAARVRLFVPSRAWGGRNRRQILFGAAAIAVLVHVLAVVGVLEASHLAHRRAASMPQVQEPPTIEMIEDDAKYSGGSKPTPPATPTPPAPPAPPTPPEESGTPRASDVPPPPSAPAATETQPPEAKPQPDPDDKQQATPPPPQAAQQPDVQLDPSSGLGYGHQDNPEVIPARPDSHANKMPAYPRAAGRRGEEGSVQMLVRINADGTVAGIDVAVSSGHPDLDNTATRAVSHWRFKPEMKNGVAVPAQMMQTFNFHIDR